MTESSPATVGVKLRRCNDCGVEPGQPHVDGCDVPRCHWTGQQRLQCDGTLAAEICRVLRAANRADLADDLAHHLDLDDPDHDCGVDIWTGEWPGEGDARALGFYCYWGPPWIECEPDHPGARPDLNRLATHARWDRTLGHWVARHV